MAELLSNNAIPITGINFTIGALIYLYLSRRFYQCYKLENNKTAGFFSLSFLFFGLNYLIMSIPTLCLISADSVWSVVDPIRMMLYSTGFFLIIYSVSYERFKKYIHIITAGLILLIIYFSFMNTSNNPTYFYVDGVLNWDPSQGLKSMISSVIFPILFMIPVMTFFFIQAKKTTDKQVKIRSLGLALFILFGMMAIIIDMFLITSLNVHPIFSDLNYFIIFMVLLFTLVKTWVPRPQKEQWVKKV